jgi:L-amino acid N-acyltransferase YncA
VAGSCAWLADHGHRRIQAEIDYANTASFAFFSSLGFTVVADRVDEVGPYAVLERPITDAS